MKQGKYKIYTLGCKVNQYDSGDLSRKMVAAGFSASQKEADIVIVNTCCVTKAAISKCKRMINKAKRENPQAKIIIMGCWPKGYREEVEKLEVDLIWGVGDLDKLIQKFPIFNFSFSNNFQNSKFKIGNFSKSRYFIKIQDGCEQFCSYCIVPYTRGKLNSRPIEDVVAEIKQAVKAGYREVVLSGVHLGLYGRDGSKKQHNGKNNKEQVNALRILLERLIKIRNLRRVRLSSIEITEVGDGLIKLVAGNNKLCKHLHIPLQSGCDKILKLMNRPYSIKYFMDKIIKIRKEIKDIAITTDVITGFPGETEKDFKETYNFIKEIKFSRLHIFPFSAHERTPAAKIKNQISRSVILKRAKELRKLGEELEVNFRNDFIGQELEVIVERKARDILCPGERQASGYIGKTQYYFNIEFNRSQINANITKNKAGNLIGKIIKVEYR